MKIKILKKMVARCVVGEYMLIPLDKGVTEYKGLFVTSEVGSRIWELICEGKDKNETAAALAEEFDAPDEIIMSDLEEFLELLRENGIIDIIEM